jgi:hypothetical protein
MSTKKTQSNSQTSKEIEAPEVKELTGAEKRAAILKARKTNLQRTRRQKLPRNLR